MQRRIPCCERRSDDDEDGGSSDDKQMAAAAVAASPCTSSHNWNSSWTDDVLRSGLATMTAPLSTYRHPNPNYQSQQQQQQQKRFFGRPQYSTTVSSSSGGMNKQLSPGMQDVASWLKGLRLHKYTEMLQAMSYEDMLALDEEILIERGVTTGARRKLIQCVNKLRDRVPLLRSFVDERGDLQADVNVVLGEVRQMLSTPLKPYDVFGQHGFGVALSDLDEKNVPGHIVCLLERIHERRRRLGKHEDSSMNLLEVYERVKKHHAFIESQRRRVASWSSALVAMIKQHQPDLLAQKRAARDGIARNGYRNRRQDSARRQTLKLAPAPKHGSDVVEIANNSMFYYDQMIQFLNRQLQIGAISQDEHHILTNQCNEEIQTAIKQVAHEIGRRNLQEQLLLQQQHQKRRHQLAQRPQQQQQPQQHHFLLHGGGQNNFSYRRWSNAGGSHPQDSAACFENSRNHHKQPPTMPLSTFPGDILAALPAPTAETPSAQHLSYNDWNSLFSNSPPAPSSSSSTSSASSHSLSDRSSAGSPPQVSSRPVLSTHSPSPSMSSNDSDESFDFVVYEFNEHTFDDAVCDDFSVGMFRKCAPIGSGRKAATLPRLEPQLVNCWH